MSWYQQDYQNRLENKYQYSAEMAEMVSLVRLANGPVLADEYMGVIPLAGKSLVFQPFEFKQLLIAGLWDEQYFLSKIYQGWFAVIIIKNDPGSQQKRWSPAQLAAIELAYKPIAFLADTIIYVPRHLQDNNSIR